MNAADREYTRAHALCWAQTSMWADDVKSPAEYADWYVEQFGDDDFDHLPSHHSAYRGFEQAYEAGLAEQAR